MNRKTEEHNLVAEAQGGSRMAFEELVRRYQKPVYYLCRRIVSDDDTARELTQRAFIRALESLQDIRDVGGFRSWLFKIAINLARNHLRNTAKFVDESHSEPVVEPQVQAILESAERSTVLRHAVARLPPKQRQVVLLRVYEELPFRDIARTLGMTCGAAKVNFHYAVKSLRNLVAAAPAA